MGTVWRHHADAGPVLDSLCSDPNNGNYHNFYGKINPLLIFQSVSRLHS